MLAFIRVDKPSISALFFSRENSRRVNDGDALKDRVRHIGTLETVEECVAKLGERTELFLGINHEGVARHNAFCVTMHHGYETVCCWFWTDPQSGEILHRTQTRYMCISVCKCQSK